MKKLLNKILYTLKNQRGSILPMIAIVVIITILIGAANFALLVMYRDRSAVRNALDAGITSSLAAHAEEEFQYTTYDEKKVCIARNWTTKTRDSRRVEDPCDSIDPVDGSCIPGYDTEYYNEDYNVRVCSEKQWQDTKSDQKNYIHLNEGAAKTTARTYIEDNLEVNNLEGKSRILSFTYEVTYDTKRDIKVEKNRDISNDRERSGDDPDGWNDYGDPAISVATTTPHEWWQDKFDGTNLDGKPTSDDWKDWNPNKESETKNIIFPRWVEVKATVEVELPVPMGKLVGRERYTATFETVAVKEVVNATR